jgi:hypothetical protein
MCTVLYKIVVHGIGVQGPHLRTPKLRVTPGSTPRIYYITEGV